MDMELNKCRVNLIFFHNVVGTHNWNCLTELKLFCSDIYPIEILQMTSPVPYVGLIKNLEGVIMAT